MIGSIGSVSLVRFKVVENMLGKLKEICNKFIINKFPKCVSNYRNVADYVVKSKMRINYTLGGDVETRKRPGSRFEYRSRPIPAVSTVPVLVNLKVFPGILNREWTTRQKLLIE